MVKAAILFLIAILFTGCDGFTVIDGFVRDTTGKPIEGVNVILEIGGRKTEYKSKADGAYSLGTSHAPFRVQPKVTASKKGYKSYQKLFPLAAGTNHKLDIVMEIDPETVNDRKDEKEIDESNPSSSRRTRRTQLRHQHR